MGFCGAGNGQTEYGEVPFWVFRNESFGEIKGAKKRIL